MSPFDGEPASPPVVTTAPPRRPSVLLLVALTAIAPFAMLMVVPLLPAMAGALNASYGTVQLTLTMSLTGLALGQLIYGPLSDRFGRKPLLIVGLCIYLVGSAAAALAPGIGLLILARILQTAGGCAGMVLSRAMIRDCWPRSQAASVLGYVSTAMAVAPMFSPLVGSLLEQHFGWRATMLVSLLLGLPLLWVVVRRLPETLAEPQPLAGLAGLLGAYAQLCRLAAFRGYVAVAACSNAVFFAFTAGAPLVVVQGLGFPATTYASAFMAIAAAWSGGAFVAARLTSRLGTHRMLVIGAAVSLVGVLIALFCVLALPAGLLAFMLPMVLVAFGNGIIQPNAIAGAVSVRPHLAGTAAGLVGALQMGAGAAMTVIAGIAENGHALGTAICMLVPAVGAQLAMVVVARAERV